MLDAVVHVPPIHLPTYLDCVAHGVCATTDVPTEDLNRVAAKVLDEQLTLDTSDSRGACATGENDGPTNQDQPASTQADVIRTS